MDHIMPRRQEADEEPMLIRRAKAGDPEAFAQIYDRCQPAIYRYILFRVNDGALAEDLTGEVFVRLVEKIDHFRYRGRPILAWLYTIARNLLNDHYRRASNSATVPLDPGPAAAIADHRWSASTSLTRETLAAALDSLTEDQRQVILLKFVEGYENADVARLMQKPVGAVKSLQHRALAALRRVLGDTRS
jgi:RNA polymerase sigma-70 factor (ECF subfamily)